MRKGAVLTHDDPGAGRHEWAQQQGQQVEMCHATEDQFGTQAPGEFQQKERCIADMAVRGNVEKDVRRQGICVDFVLRMGKNAEMDLIFFGIEM